MKARWSWISRSARLAEIVGAGTPGSPGETRRAAVEPCGLGDAGPRAGLAPPPQEAVERDGLAARERDGQVKRQGREDLVEAEKRDRQPPDGRDDDHPGQHGGHPAEEPHREQSQDARQTSQAGRSSASGTKNQNDQASG